MQGYNKMLEIIKPSAIICYDLPFNEMRGNIKICRYDDDWGESKLTAHEYMKRYFEQYD